jgi:hypothetical protein
VDSSCLTMTLNCGAFESKRSNSLSTNGCGERMQTVSLVFVRLVDTVRLNVSVEKTVLWGKDLGG